MPQYTYSLIPYMSFLGIVIYFVFCHWIQGYLHICVIGPIYHRYKKIVTHNFPRSNTLRQLVLYYKSCHPLQGPCNHNYRTWGNIKVLERISTHTASVICAIYFERTIHYYSRSSTVLPLFSKKIILCEFLVKSKQTGTQFSLGASNKQKNFFPPKSSLMSQ